MSQVKIREKIGYGGGEMAVNLAYQTISLFLLYFFTDRVHLSPLEASLVVFIGKFWDALANPIVGILVDKTRTKMGSKRPFLLAAALPLGISFALLFLDPPMAAGLKFWYALGSYLLFSTFIALVTIPHGSLTASMTLDSSERSNISTFRMSFGLIGTLLAGGLTPILSTSLGWSPMAVLFGLVMVVSVLGVFFSVKERHTSPAQEFSLKNAWEAIKANPPFQILAVASLLMSTALNFLASTLIYFIIYIRGDFTVVLKPDGTSEYQVGGTQILAFAALLLTALISMPFFNKLAAKTSKKRAFQVGILAIIITLIGLFFGNQGPFWLIILLFVIGGLGMSVMYLSPWSMIPDTVEYSQWKTGRRQEGILYGVFYFVFKLASALALFFSGMVLQFSGYLPNMQQSPSAFYGILALETLVPLALFVIGLIVLSRYPLDRAMHEKILSELNLKKD